MAKHNKSILRKSAFVAATLTIGFLISEPAVPTAEAVVPPPGLAAAIIQALPTIGTVIGQLFGAKKPSSDQQKAIDSMNANSKKASDALNQYADREQIVWRVVSASSLSTANLAAMRQVLAYQTKLTEDQLTDLRGKWKFAKQGVTAIVESKPNTKVFNTDAPMIIALNKLLLNGKAASDAIDENLKEKDPSTKLVQQTQDNVKMLSDIFELLNDSTGAEVQLIADELATLATVDSKEKDPSKVVDPSKAKPKKSGETAFANVSLFTEPLQENQKALDNLMQMQIKFQ